MCWVTAHEYNGGESVNRKNGAEMEQREYMKMNMFAHLPQRVLEAYVHLTCSFDLLLDWEIEKNQTKTESPITAPLHTYTKQTRNPFLQ